MFDKLKRRLAREAWELWLLIQEGKPHKIGLAPKAKYKALYPQRIEARMDLEPEPPSAPGWDVTGLTVADVEELVLGYYREKVAHGHYIPGRYGDWIKCTRIKCATLAENASPEGQAREWCVVDFIGQGAWVKPTLAADLGIFIKSGPLHYFVSVIRKNPPGQGKKAILGGIIRAGHELDSGIATMIREAEEEANLRMEYLGDSRDMAKNYGLTEAPVKVRGFERLDPSLADLEADIHLVTAVPTPEQERNPDGTKRVYATVCYAVYIDLGAVSAPPKKILKVFSAGDDAAGVAIDEVTKAVIGDPRVIPDKPEFGLEHHNALFDEMVWYYKRRFMGFPGR